MTMTMLYEDELRRGNSRLDHIRGIDSTPETPCFPEFRFSKPFFASAPCPRTLVLDKKQNPRGTELVGPTGVVDDVDVGPRRSGRLDGNPERPVRPIEQPQLPERFFGALGSG